MTAVTGRWQRRGVALEGLTLGWNVVGVVVLAVAAAGALSTALAGFAADSLIEIGASTAVLWELRQVGLARRRRALLLIAAAFAALAVYLLVQSATVLAVGHRAGVSGVGLAWTAVTVVVMVVLAATLGWWWADPAAGILISAYAAREALAHRRDALTRPDHSTPTATTAPTARTP